MSHDSQNPAAIDRKQLLARVKSIVVKIGTNALSDSAGKLDRSLIAHFAQQVATLRQRGIAGAGQELQLRPSTHPVAVALRTALARRLPEFPAVQSVWVSHARWLDTGAEHAVAAARLRRLDHRALGAPEDAGERRDERGDGERQSLQGSR